MLRLFLFFVLTVLLPVSSYAADQGVKKKDIVRQVLRGSFTAEQSIKGEDGTKKQQSEGKFVVVPGYGVIVTMEKPEPGSVVFTKDNMGVVSYDTVTMRVPTREKPQFARVHELLVDGLMGKWESFDKDFSIERRGDKSDWSVKLSTRAINRTKVPFTVITASGGSFITSLGFVEPTGSYASYKIFNQRLSEEAIKNEDWRLFAMTDGTTE